MKAACLARLCGALSVILGAESAQARGPVELWANYTAEAWRNVAGGRRVGDVHLSKTEAGFVFDGERALGRSGLTLSLVGAHTNGGQLSEPLVGDLHTISNIDAPRSTTLQEAWIEQAVGDVALKAGVIDLNSEFDVNEAGAVFINGAHGIGPEFSQAGDTGPSIFPTPGLAARLRIQAGDWTLRLGAFDGQPGDPVRPGRQDLHLSGGDGALYVAEGEREIGDSASLRIGGWRHTGVAASGRRTGRGEGAYALLEPSPVRWRGQRVRTFVRLGAASGDDLPVARYLGAGVVLESATQGVGALGFALAVSEYAPRYLRADGRREMNLELTYRRQATPWLAVQPNLQWISTSGGDRSLGAAWAVGLRFDFAWSQAFGPGAD